MTKTENITEEFWNGWFVTTTHPGQKKHEKIAGPFITEADAKIEKDKLKNAKP